MSLDESVLMSHNDSNDCSDFATLAVAYCLTFSIHVLILLTSISSSEGSLVLL